MRFGDQGMVVSDKRQHSAELREAVCQREARVGVEGKVTECVDGGSVRQPATASTAGEHFRVTR